MSVNFISNVKKRLYQMAPIRVKKIINNPRYTYRNSRVSYHRYIYCDVYNYLLTPHADNKVL